MRVWTIPVILGMAVMLAFSPVTAFADAGECKGPNVGQSEKVGYYVGLYPADGFEKQDKNENGWVCISVLMTPGTTKVKVYDDIIPK